MRSFGRTDTEEILLLPLTDEDLPDEAAARQRFKFGPGPLPLVPHIKVDQPAPVAGKIWVALPAVWYADRVEDAWMMEDIPTPTGPKIWHDSELFMAEFQLGEMASIALSQNITIAALRLMLSTWHSSIRSDDPRVIAGLDALEAEGIISADRRAEIEAL